MPIHRFLRVTLGLAATAGLALTGAADAGARTASAEDRPTPAAEPLLYYNHAYAVVDRETADAIEDSAYLREFAHFEVRTTTGGDLTWTGRYLYGRSTYLELFGEGDLPGQDAAFGSSALAVSTENEGDLDTVTARLAELGITDPVEFRQTRDFGDGVRVPWFDGVNTPVTAYDAFGAWGMEYRPEYFADPRSNTEPASHPGDVGRERYHSDAYQDHLLREVTGIRLGVTRRDLTDNLPLLIAGGMEVRTLPGGSVVADDGVTRIRFDVVPADEVGLRRVDMALNEPTGEREVERIGRSTLTVGPHDHAVWTFDARQ
jgi:hypothetical protein